MRTGGDRAWEIFADAAIFALIPGESRLCLCESAAFLAALQFLLTAAAGVRGKSQPLSRRWNGNGVGGGRELMGWVAASPWGCARRRGSPRELRALGAALLLSGDRDGAKGTGTWGSLERGPPRWEQVPAVRSVAPAGDAPCLPLASPRAHRRCFFPPFLPKFVHAQGSREPARTSLELGLFWLRIACSIKHASGSTRPRHRSLSLLFHTPPSPRRF